MIIAVCWLAVPQRTTRRFRAFWAPLACGVQQLVSGPVAVFEFGENLSHTPGKTLHLAGVFSGQRRKTQAGGQ
jgi:hypothetical protein